MRVRTEVARAPVVALVIAVAALAAACGVSQATPVPASAAPVSAAPVSTALGSAAPATPAQSPAPSGAAPSTPPPATPAPAPSAAPAGTTAPVDSPAPPSPAGAVVEDPSLLSVLPASLAGVPVNHEAQAFAEAATDPAFAGNVQSAAFAVAVDGEDLASAVVARPNPGVYSETFFRDWRDSYNEGACGQSGGVTGNAQSEIGKQTVYIGTCAGGLRTYHAWLADKGLLVSAFSLGDRRFGELLMAGLQP